MQERTVLVQYYVIYELDLSRLSCFCLEKSIALSVIYLAALLPVQTYHCQGNQLVQIPVPVPNDRVSRTFSDIVHLPRLDFQTPIQLCGNLGDRNFHHLNHVIHFLHVLHRNFYWTYHLSPILLIQLFIHYPRLPLLHAKYLLY